MKAKFLALAALVLGLASCQTDPQDLDVTTGGEQAVTINVALPEEVTRAAGSDSALGGIGNVNMGDYDIRYILEVYDENGVLAKDRMVQTSDAISANFDLRLVPGRAYNFVVWADFVTDGTNDLYYDTSAGLRNVQVEDDKWDAIIEARDAYTDVFTVHEFSSASTINMTLTRPFAKLRVVTDDIDEMISIRPAEVKVKYFNTKLYTTFDAFAEKASGVREDKELTVTLLDAQKNGVDTYTGGLDAQKGVQTLFADYFFGAEDDRVMFTFDVKDNGGRDLPQVTFNTNIPVERNHLTTIYGPILTDSNNVKVTIDSEFANQDNLEDEPYYQQAVTNGVELIKALMAGQEIIVLDNITVTAADVAEATRAGVAIYPVINLNGFTITIENTNTEALVNLNGGALTVEGEGAIESTAGALVEGTTVVTGEAEVEAEVAVDENGQSAVKSGLEALVYICKNGGEFTFTENIEAKEVLLVSATKPVVINGANCTLTSTATRAIRVESSKANVTINNLNIVVATERVYPNDVRGISLDPDLNGVDLALNNCSVDFTHKTANDWAYAVNVSGNGTDNKVTVNGGTYNGANVVNAHSAKNTIVVKNATLTSLYPNNDTYYGSCIWVLQNQGSTVYAEGNTFNGNNAVAFNLGTGTTLEEKDNTDNTKCVTAKVNGAYYYNIADAINAAEDGATVTVLHNHDCNVGATVPAGKTLTIDLNKKTVSGKTFGNTNPQDLFLVKGNLSVKNGTITTEHVGDNLGWSAMTTIFDITGGGVVNLNGVTAKNLGGTDMGFVAHLNNWGEVTLNVEGSTLESNYVAVRVFNSGYDMNNVTINNSTLKGGNYAFWVHNYTVADFGTVEKAEAQKALLNFDIFNGTNTFEGKNDTPIRYGMNNAIYTAPGDVIVTTTEELIAALKDANVKAIVLGQDITVTEKWDNRYTGAKTTKAITINGNGNTLKFACEVSDGFNYQAAFRFEAPAVVKNLTIDMSEVPGTGSWLRAISTKGDITVDNCTFIGSTNYTSGRGIAYGEGAGTAAVDIVVSVTNSTFTNWTRRGLTDNENGQDAKNVTVVNNTFTNADAYVSAHDSIVFTGNTMTNSAANFRTYSNATDATVVATGNTLDADNENNVIRGFVAANVESQEGFTIL